MGVGDKIKKLRDSLKMTQKEFAETLDMSQTAISQYELEQKQPSLKVLNKIIKLSKRHNIKIKFLDE